MESSLLKQDALDHDSVTAEDFANGNDDLRLDFDAIRGHDGHRPEHHHHSQHRGHNGSNNAGFESSTSSTKQNHPSTMGSEEDASEKKVKIRKRKGPRAQTIEEVFATISTVRSSGLNPPQEHIVLTPRSAEACLRCGVNPETLKIRDLESFYDTDVSPAVQRMRHEAYSMRRHEEMKAVRAEKKKIIEAEDAADALGSPKSTSPPHRHHHHHHHHKSATKTKMVKSAQISPDKASEQFSLLDIEKKRLEKVKFRQERELEQMLDFEIKMSKIQQEANEKAERERRLHEQRERERMRFAQELAEEKRQREIKKKAQMDAEEERRKLLAAEMAARDRELAEQKVKQERLRRIEAREREEERKAKAEEHRLMTEAIMRQQQQEISERLQELDLAERARNEMVEQQRLERARQMEERRRIVGQRIRKNLKQSKKLELQRKREITRKQQASEQVRQEHEAEMERQRELARQQQEMMERKRMMVIEDAKREEERKKDELLHRQYEMERNVHQLQETQQQQLELKKEYRRIQQQLKLDKVERMKRIQEYKRLETLRKMQETEMRTQAMLNEKDELVRRRKQIAVKAKIQRDLIMRTMENVKITKKWNQASKTIEQVIGKSSSRSPSPTKSISGRPKSSSGALSRQTSLPNITRPNTPGSAGMGAQSRVFRPPSPPPTRTAFKFTKEAQEEMAANANNKGGSSSAGVRGGAPQAYFSPYDQVPEQIRPKKSKHVRSCVKMTPSADASSEGESKHFFPRAQHVNACKKPTRMHGRRTSRSRSMRLTLRAAALLLALSLALTWQLSAAIDVLEVRSSTPAVTPPGEDAAIEVEVHVDGSPSETLEMLEEEERAAVRRRRKKPQVESLLADFDHDGYVGSSEIQRIKENLHQFFDIDESGSIDSVEIKTMARDEKDVVSAFQKLDSDHDSIISLKELDERWEAVGAEMTVSEVADWVAFAVQLPQYANIFRDHSISGYTFPLLMANDGKRLQEIGIDQHLHRQQLAMFLKMKYLGMGKKPAPVVSAVCTAEPSATGSESGQAPSKTLLHVAWVPAEDVPQRFQLQRRSPGEATWSLVYTGPDTEFIDVVDTGLHVAYRLATWNSYGRSPHEYIRCGPVAGVASTKPALVLPPAASTTSGSIIKADALPGHHALNFSSDGGESADTFFGVLKSYLWWLDEAIALTLFIVLPIRGFIYGDADYVLKIMRRLPPNMPTRVTVEADPSKTSLEGATVTVSWEKPIDNGVPIVCYCVRWTRTKTEEMKWVKLLTLPLPTSVSVSHLKHGETYKIVVEATNQFGLVTKSSRSTYMVPVPELKGKLLPRRSMKEAKVLRNQCHICSDPVKKKKVPFTATLDRRILHFCCLCDQEFCHYHKGEVYHTKALSCPAVDGRCICETCKDIRLQRSVTY